MLTFCAEVTQSALIVPWPAENAAADGTMPNASSQDGHHFRSGSALIFGRGFDTLTFRNTSSLLVKEGLSQVEKQAYIRERRGRLLDPF